MAVLITSPTSVCLALLWWWHHVDNNKLNSATVDSHLTDWQSWKRLVIIGLLSRIHKQAAKTGDSSPETPCWHHRPWHCLSLTTTSCFPFRRWCHLFTILQKVGGHRSTCGGCVMWERGKEKENIHPNSGGVCLRLPHHHGYLLEENTVYQTGKCLAFSCWWKAANRGRQWRESRGEVVRKLRRWCDSIPPFSSSTESTKVELWARLGKSGTDLSPAAAGQRQRLR